MYGGAAGGGKSVGLLTEATLYVDDYPTKSLLIRKTYKDLSQPGGLMDMSHSWFRQTDAAWDGQNFRWTFPSGATVSFGYLDNEQDHLRYQGGEYHMFGFDELTQLRESQFMYLFSRVRRLKGFPVPSRVRAATNPGGPGHEWVRKRYNLPKGPKYPMSLRRKFVFATLDDNPHLDEEDYLESLQELIGDQGVEASTTYLQLRRGDWTAMGTGGFFDPKKFKITTYENIPAPSQFRNIIRYWDFAATERTDENPDPDWTVGLKIGVTFKGRVTKDNPGGFPDYYIFGVTRGRWDSYGVEQTVKEVAHKDGPGVVQWVEQERGAAGKLLVAMFRNNVLPSPFTVRGLYATHDKEARARGPAGRLGEGRIYLVTTDKDRINDTWIPDFLAECGVFPGGDFDDQVDALGNGFIALDREIRMQMGGINHVVTADEMRGRSHQPDPLANVYHGY